MIFLFAILLSALSFTSFSQESCFIDAFGNEYEGQGRTLQEAKIRARVLCSENHEPMFCSLSKANCMRYPHPSHFYCEIETFNNLYYEFARTRSRATRRAMVKCQRNHASSFCSRGDVVCYNL